MPALNIVSNLFNTLYNNEVRRKKECLVLPTSRFASEILRVMQSIGTLENLNKLMTIEWGNSEFNY
jgi:ribosomal protein S8